ncbi:MAG: hypothetical protein V4466_17995 [Pseudomonadota bacterium]
MTAAAGGRATRRRIVLLGLALSAAGGAALAAEPQADRARASDLPRPRRPLIDPAQVERSDGRPLTVEFRAADPDRAPQKAPTIYTHIACGTDSALPPALAAGFASGQRTVKTAACRHCRGRFPLHQFVWKGTTEAIGP